MIHEVLRRSLTTGASTATYNHERASEICDYNDMWLQSSYCTAAPDLKCAS